MFSPDILKAARQNDNFRQVLFTGDHSQVVVMSLTAGEEIGLETHPDHDQILLVVDGQANILIGEEERALAAGGLGAVPAGTPHNVVNTGDTALKLVTIYGPANHAPGTVHPTKADALKDEELDEQ